MPSEAVPAKIAVIVEFLSKTDQALGARVGRRMLNYLSWHGVTEAQQLLLRVVGDAPEDTSADENRPSERSEPLDGAAVLNEAFEIAGRHLPQDEVVASIEKSIKDDKAAFLIEAVEHQWTSLADIAQALERYDQFTDHDRELSRAVQTGLRVSLARRLLTDDVEFVDKAKAHLEVEDYHNLLQHTIAPTSSHGKLGGKSAGLILAAAIVRRSTEYGDVLGGIRVPKTWYMTSDSILTFIEHNELDDVHNHKYLELEQIRREYPHLVQVFKHSHFPSELAQGLNLALDDFGDVPLIVRSSSLLEDRTGAAFSGKYKSLFLANQGTRAERLGALMDAIAEVYASVFGPDPIEYRANRGLLDLHEEMGIMIQQVVGTRLGPYYLPAYAGVAFSDNEFRWSPRIGRSDGLVRLVPGLGTRAVDRVSDDYPVLVAPGKPGLRANVTPAEIERYAPRKIDLINLESGQFETVAIADLLREHGLDFPSVRQIVSVPDESGVHRPVAFGWHPESSRPIVTFEGLLRHTTFVTQMNALLRLLRARLGTPVDIEFACDGRHFYLLQCRPQSSAADVAPVPVPRDVPPERVVFATRRYVSNGRVPDLAYIVYVDPDGYLELPTLTELTDVGRAVGRLNKLLPKRQFVLIGPGRWGSRGDIKLGVRVTYSDLNNAAMLMEVAARRGSYVPELSFGTHFFQDLVESDIRYLPLFPGEPDVAFNVPFLRDSPNMLGDLVPEYAHLAKALHVIDVRAATGGSILRVFMNAETEEALGMLTDQPGGYTAPSRTFGPRETAAQPASSQEEPWRWRLSMAERLAADADPARFAVKAMYVFGSTKNGTARPDSDIDLLVHADPTPEQRVALESWLDGWSACLAEVNYLRTGHRRERMLTAHIVSTADVEAGSGYAKKIGAPKDPARPLKLGVK